MYRAFYLLVLLCGNASLLHAQAALEVTVLDGKSGKAVPSLSIQVENAAIGWRGEEMTDGQGRVRFDGLSTSGRYTVSTPGDQTYSESRVADLVLRVGAVRSVTLYRLPMPTGELQEITVTGSTGFARLNQTNAEVSSTLGQRETEALPVEARDLTRALFRLPNVTQATGFYPEAPNVSINGSNGLFTNYLIDGLDNNENFLGGQKFRIPIGMVQDVTVLTNTFSAEYGRTANGVFNVTTRAGSNRQTGEVFYLVRPGPVIDASSPYAQRDLSGNSVKDGFQRHQFGFGLGMPIVADRTFFYANVEQLIDVKDNLLDSPSLGVRETVRGENFFSLGSLRIDHRWNPRWRTVFRGHLGLVDIERQGGGLEGGVTFPSAANKQQQNALTGALQNTYLGSDFVVESNFQYSRFRWNYAQPMAGENPRVELIGSNGLPVAFVGHPGFSFNDLENSLQLQQKFTTTRGRHTLKAGVDLMTSDFGLLGGGPPTGLYVVHLSPAQELAVRERAAGGALDVADVPADARVQFYSVELRPAAFGARQTQVAGYVEDQFAASARLTVTLGLRYDFDSLSRGGATRGDLNNIAPRLNANLRLGRASSLRGGYGMFYDKIVYAIYSDALQQNSTAAGFRGQLETLVSKGILPADTDIDRITFDGNVTASFLNPTFGLNEGPSAGSLQNNRESVVRNDGRILNPNGYDNPYSHQFSLGYQRQLGDDGLVYIDAVHVRAEYLFRLRDLNAPSPWRITREQVEQTASPESLVRSPEEADATRPAEVVAGGSRNIVVSESAGSGRYWAVSANWFKERGGSNLAWRLSYTLSRLRNDTDDINFRAQDANDFDAEWGPSINDRTHVLNAITYAYIGRKTLITLAGLVQSGQPVNRIPDAPFGTTDLNGDGRSFGDAYLGNSDRYPGESRNSDRLPWSHTIDIGLRHTLPIGPDHIELQADVFNTLNVENLSGYSNFATLSNQIQPGPASSGTFIQRNAGPPRQFQFGVRYVF